MTTVLHVSDVHFGAPAVLAQVDALEGMMRNERFDVVAVSGDLSQRARPGELQRARTFLRDARATSAVIVVPGNHDVKWWRAPLGIGDRRGLYANYRRYIDENLEPVLRVPGVTFVGLNTAHGVMPHTLTWNPRDIGVVGGLTAAQVAHAREEFERSPAGDLRAIVMHHNPLKGELSRRFGLSRPRRALGAWDALGVDLIMSGHDHQEAVHFVPWTSGGGGTVILTAGTVSDRSRGKRPPSVHVVTLDRACIGVTTWIWSAGARDFRPGPVQTFPR